MAMVWPAAAMARIRSWPAWPEQALPTTKKVALTPQRSRTSSTRPVLGEGPSSKVRQHTFPPVTASPSQAGA